MYQEEMVSIIGAMGHRLVAIEHVGSTSVPGLAAKPIIDIMAAIDSLDNAQECIGPLKDLGYEYIPEYEDVRPERRYFHKGPAAARTHHLHVVELHSAFWSRHILFRDYLRTHPEEASRYVQLKRELAARYGADRLGYQDAKGPYITLVEEKARVASEINLLRRSP
ncbi:MAG: GrpB family protein [Chloroflexi bacterium]|nr:GrpB family protein [Chloroflexota bacterium]